MNQNAAFSSLLFPWSNVQDILAWRLGQFLSSAIRSASYFSNVSMTGYADYNFIVGGNCTADDSITWPRGRPGTRWRGGRGVRVTSPFFFASFLFVFFVHLLRDTLNKLLNSLPAIRLQICVSRAASILGIRVYKIARNFPASCSLQRNSNLMCLNLRSAFEQRRKSDYLSVDLIIG